MLHTTNFYAYHKLYGTIPDILFNEKHDMFEPEKKVKELAVFEKRINGIPSEYRKYALAIYANPVVNKMRNKENKVGKRGHKFITSKGYGACSEAGIAEKSLLDETKSACS